MDVLHDSCYTVTMKIPQMMTIAASLLVAGCASDSPSTAGHHPPSTTGTPADWLVISATYGTGTNYADVTYRVNDLLHQPDVEFFARPEWLATDPKPWWNKNLVIVYEVKGHRHIFTAGEGGKVSVAALLEQARK